MPDKKSTSRLVYAKDVRERITSVDYALQKLKRLLDNHELTMLEQFVIDEAMESVANSITYLKRTVQEEEEK